MSTVTPFRTGYVSIVGKPNVGKSTLLNKLVQQKISITSKKAQTTRYRIQGILTENNTQFIFVDTPGFQKQFVSRLNTVMNRVVTQSMLDVDVVLFVIETTRFDDRDKLVVKLLPKNIPVILIINKIDNLSNKNVLLPFLHEIENIFDFSAIVPISAIDGTQIPELLNTIRKYLPEAQPLFAKDQITDRSERFLAAEILREKLFRLVGEEIPYSTSVVIEQFLLEENLRKIYASILVDRSNQKAIVIGKNGDKLKLIASQARKDMEKLFGNKVYLEIWVKVRSGWADNVNVLKSLGHE
ncbi:MAG: GTPase Era [Nitrosomonas sp.]|nr:GTPase Era [Nitrosomonas sp.]